MTIYAISDLHGNLPYIPECDLLLLGGDYCPIRNLDAERKFISGRFTDWLKGLKANHIVGIAGNHDFILQEDTKLARSLPWMYLEDEAVEIEHVKIYGTPWTKQFYNWAFMKEDADLKDVFANIPEGLDILLSHGPPYKMLDKASSGVNCGSKSLLDRIIEVKPDSVVCGHIHEGRGVTEYDGIRIYNVSYLNGNYEPKYNAVSIPLKA